jgi:polysaccharide biosynthesis protein PelE
MREHISYKKRITLTLWVIVAYSMYLLATLLLAHFFYYHEPFISATILFFSLRIIINVPILLIIWRVIPEHYRHNSPYSFILALTISVLIPILGFLFIIIGGMLLHYYIREEDEIQLKYISMPEYNQDKIYGSTFFSVGGASSRLRCEKVPTQDRIKSLSAINLKVGIEANQFNRVMLHETNDELRLYAFSLLEKQENSINHWIIKFLKEMNDSTSEKKLSFFRRQLALLYWEMHYLNLAQEELRDFLLKKSLYYAEEQLKITPDDASMYVLCARIHMLYRDTQKTQAALYQAISLDVPSRQVAAYMAGIAFYEKDYMQVKTLLTSDPALRYLFPIEPLIRFWRHYHA